MTQERVSKSYTFEKMHFPDKAYLATSLTWQKSTSSKQNVREEIARLLHLYILFVY